MDNNTSGPVIPEEPRAQVRRKPLGPGVIIAVGVVVTGLIFLFGKTVFVSNPAEAPRGLDTATINTDVTEPAETLPPENDPAQTVTSVGAEGVQGGDTSPVSETTESIPEEEAIGVMYVTDYVQLHKEPDSASENIVCMSPGIAVNVIEYDESGYVKVSFNNIDGPVSGYVWSEYLSEYQTVVPSWQQEGQEE